MSVFKSHLLTENIIINLYITALRINTHGIFYIAYLTIYQ